MGNSAEARVIVGLDFGTTFSGFAYSHAANPGSILTFYDWPSQSRGGGKPYCKTQTSLYYLRKGDAARSPRYELVDWGWSAQLERARAGEREDGFFVTRFKLHLAPGRDSLVAEDGGDSKSSKKKRRTSRSGTIEDQTRGLGLLNALPPGMTSERVISDYLLKISEFAFKHLQCTYGAHITSQDVQWCLTVPAIWDNGAKQKMKKCAQRAGLVTGPHCPDSLASSASRHPIVIVLESEAASVYCANKSKELNLEKGAQFLVADVGGGTVDIVVHSKENGEGSSLRLKEVRHSKGGLCGGSHVDKNFLNFMSKKIGCFNSFAEDNPGIITQFLRTWEDIKGSYDPWHGWDDVDFEIPSKLSKAWKSHVREQSRGRNKETGLDFEQVILTSTDMKSIFDPVVEQVIDLIKRQMTPEINVMMLVGGFSASPYLRARLKLCFKGQRIITPPDPGSAVCQGAVILGFAPEIVMSRISRKTYGLQVSDLFRHGTDPPEAMQRESVRQHTVCWCCSRFMTFVRKGQEIATDECVSHALSPTVEGMKEVVLNVYSYGKQPEPEYVTQPGVKLEGTFSLDISHDPENMNLSRRFVVSMYFGKSCIQVKAQRKNFGNTEEVIEMHDSFAFDYDMLERPKKV